MVSNSTTGTYLRYHYSTTVKKMLCIFAEIW